MSTWYCTVEDVLGALESRATGYDEGRVRRAIGAASRDVDDVVQRTDGVFRPLRATILREWPSRQTSAYHRLYLDANSLISVETLSSGGVTIPPSAFFLEPQDYGPPYTRIEIDLGDSYAFSFTDSTPQRAVSITGLWGWSDDREPAGTLVGAITDVATTATCSNGGALGTGDHIVIGTERLEVTGKTWTDSSQVLGAPGLTALAANTTVAVTTGSAYTAGEALLLDSERMTVVDVAGNNLSVKRARDGSVLAAHTAGTTIYARRGLTLARGAQGSTAAAHSNGDAISRHVVPPDVAALAVASAITTHLSELGGYTREYGPQGSGSKLGVGIDDLRARVEANYGRQCRTRVV